MKPSRVIGLNKLTDSRLQLAVEFRHDEWKNLLMEAKEKRFREYLDVAINGVNPEEEGS